MSRLYRIFISTAEISGDLHGATLVRNLNRRYPGQFEFSALGGEALRQEGVDILEDLSTQSSIGLQESLRYVFHSFGLVRRIRRHLKTWKPDLTLCIDGQGRNLPLGRMAHRMGLKTAYYFPPLVFIWGRWNLRRMRDFDLILCPFHPNAELIRTVHPRVVYTGHPFSILPESIGKEEARERLGLAQNPIIGLFPGSRHQEVVALTKIFLLVGKKILQAIPHAHVVVSLAHPEYGRLIRRMTERYLPQARVIADECPLVMQASDFLLACSGTATLEAAFYAVPTAVAYRISQFSYLLARLLIHVDYISMTNILSGEEIFKEFINRDCSVENLSRYALSILKDKSLWESIVSKTQNLVRNIRVPDHVHILTSSIKAFLDETKGESISEKGA